MKLLFHSLRLSLFAPFIIALAPAAFAAEVPLSDTWILNAAEENASLAKASSTGFEMTVGESAMAFPRVAQTFRPVSLGQIGQSLKISFEVELLTELFEDNGSDFRFSFFDTSTNYEMITMISMGPSEAKSQGIKFRIDGFVSEGSDTFVPGDFTAIGGGGQSRGSTAPYPGEVRFAKTGIVHRFESILTRESIATLSYETKWTIVSGSEDADGEESLFRFEEYDETTGAVDESLDPTVDNPERASDVWAEGGVQQINGFGFVIRDEEPFLNPADPTVKEGSFRISNLKIEGDPLWEFQILDATHDATANEDQVRWQSIPGKYYAVQRSSDLQSWEDAVTDIVAEELVTTQPLAREDAGGQYYRVALLESPPAYSEDFESGAEGWELLDPGTQSTEWELGTPTAGPDGAHSGANAYGTDLDGPYVSGTRTILRSPVIDLTQTHRPDFSFWYYIDATLEAEGGQLQFLDENNEVLYTHPDIFWDTSDGWVQCVMPIPEEARQKKIRLEFMLISDGNEPNGQGWFIDDLEID